MSAMTEEEYEARRRRIAADAEDARKSLIKARAVYEGLCDELRLLRLTWLEQQRSDQS